MKKLIVAGITLCLAALLTLSGCSVSNSSDIEFHAENIKYVRDYRTDLCYAVTTTRKSGEYDNNGMGMANVPCTDAVLNLIEQ